MREDLDDLRRERQRLTDRLRELNDEIERIELQAHLAELSPQERRKLWTIIAGGATVAAAGVVNGVRQHPTMSVVTMLAMVTAALFGIFVFRGPGGEPDVRPDVPFAVRTPSLAPAPSVSPSPNPAQTPTPTPTQGVPDLEVPGDVPTRLAPAVTSAPTSTSEPGGDRPPASPPGSPSPEPTPTEQPTLEPSEPPEPSPTPTEPPAPTPSPTPTVEPPQDKPLLCVDVELVVDLEACLDLPVLDGLLGDGDDLHAAGVERSASAPVMRQHDHALHHQLNERRTALDVVRPLVTHR